MPIRHQSVPPLRQTSHQGKTPCNQGLSCLIKSNVIFQTTAKLAHPPAGWGGPAGGWSNCVPRRNPLLGERKQVRASVTTNQSPFAPTRAIKAKTPVIVHDQGKSRQTMKKQNPTITSANGAAPYQPRATLWVRSPYMPPALQGRPIPPIKAKTPAIKANRASSRQTPFFKPPSIWRTHPLDGADRPANGQNVYQGEILSWGKQVRASVTTNQSPIALPRAIKAKTPVIVHDQGKSRQTMKKQNPTITSANGAAPYQPRATLWVRPPYATSPARAAHPANQGKTPCNRA